MKEIGAVRHRALDHAADRVDLGDVPAHGARMRLRGAVRAKPIALRRRLHVEALHVPATQARSVAHEQCARVARRDFGRARELQAPRAQPVVVIGHGVILRRLIAGSEFAGATHSSGNFQLADTTFT